VKKTYSVTPRQIAELDEITRDRSSAKTTLEIALQYHSNILNRIVEKEKKWWDEIIAIHELDKSIVWTFDPQTAQIKRKEEEA